MTDRYPTDAELRRIRRWPMEKGYRELMEYVRSIWTYADAGYWRETGRRPAEIAAWSHKPGQRYYFVSTGGWSGNEDIMGAMERNWMFMALCWERSRKGGHYLFAVPPLFAGPQPEKTGRE